MDEETISKGTLFFLWHPEDELFSGYGLTVEKDNKAHLVGFLMVDRPYPVDPTWLKAVEAQFGEYVLYPMTTGGERGIVCQMWIEKSSLKYLRQVHSSMASVIQSVLMPFLNQLPKPQFELHWDKTSRTWKSSFLKLTKKGLMMESGKPKELFSLGQVVATPGALDALIEADQAPTEFLQRHVAGDWGSLDDADKKENELSIEKGFRILSAYQLNSGVKIWIITEADRSATTLLLPSDY